MSAVVGVWGMPDFGTMLTRSRVIDTLLRTGNRPVVLQGTSGCGKSVATSQYALATGRDVVWVDACGESLTAEQVAVALVRLLPSSCREDLPEWSDDTGSSDPVGVALHLLRNTLADRGVVVVVDDLGRADECAVESLTRLARLMRGANSQLVINTRNTDNWPSTALCEWVFAGSGELAFDRNEAEEFCALTGARADSGRVEEVRESCQGHPALFALIVGRAGGCGLGYPLRSTSLDAWLGRLIDDQLTGEQRSFLSVACLLKAGDELDLASLGITDAGAKLRNLSETLPLVALGRKKSGAISYRIHDLVDEFLVDNLVSTAGGLTEDLIRRAVGLLSDRDNFARAIELQLRHPGSTARVDWLENHGRRALSFGVYNPLERLLSALSVHELVCRPRLLLLWAELCSEKNMLEDALAKCQAARSLAEHDGDSDTLSRASALTLRCLCRSGRLDEAEALSRSMLSRPTDCEPALRAEALVSLSRAQLARGDDPIGAIGLLADVESAVLILPAESSTRHVAANLAAIAQILAYGDWKRATRILSPLVSAPRQLVSSTVMAMGNLGLSLLELGRVDRARGLLRRALREAEMFGLDSYVGAYTPTMGVLEVSAGNLEDGLRLLQEGIALVESTGDADEAQLDRVYLSSLLRASGRASDALGEAESAFERLSVVDHMGFRRLAALEVAASLLALGDINASRAWVESIASEGSPPNDYHRLRADMILAEVSRREGDADRAVALLARHERYIVSENANWQMAMYCRSFPELLGLLAMAVGPELLPAHMLRMIMPEQAEVTLMCTKSLVPEETWRELGLRLLGADEFAHFIERDGLPLCHVRMFGGLEVNIGARSVRERDWRKRKARLLFTMLMLHRGQDIAREQVFEHLWPEMDEERAKSNLYVIWSAMKSVLMQEDAERGVKCPYVESIGGVCRAVARNVRTDVDAFEAACSRARTAHADGDTAEAMKAYRDVSEIYRGDLLPGDCYDDWFANLREHYRSAFIDMMLSATELELSAGHPHEALTFVRRALQFDQFREDLYQAALRCQIAAGQRSSAIDTYLQCRDRLCEELGLDPSPELRALYAEILAMEERVVPMDFDPLGD